MDNRIFREAEEKALRDYYRILDQEWLADELKRQIEEDEDEDDSDEQI